MPQTVQTDCRQNPNYQLLKTIEDHGGQIPGDVGTLSELIPGARPYKLLNDGCISVPEGTCSYITPEGKKLLREMESGTFHNSSEGSV